MVYFSYYNCNETSFFGNGINKNNRYYIFHCRFSLGDYQFSISIAYDFAIFIAFKKGFKEKAIEKTAITIWPKGCRRRETAGKQRLKEEEKGIH